jgi:phospholipid/cholesterol/gamma-HCH transport system substrate-binding protein
VSRRTEIEVGVTVLVALGILLWGVTWLKEFSLERQVRVWYVTFPQTGGLGPSDEVQVNGIRKGAVRAMKLAGDHVVVELGVASDVALTRDSRVAIRNVGLMGEKVIAVDLKTTGGAYAPDDTIAGIYEKGVPEVMADLGGSIEAISTITMRLQSAAEVLVKSGDFASTVRNFRLTSEELRRSVQENRAALRSTLENFSAAAKTARGLTTDREAELRRTLDQFSEAAENMNRLSVRLDSLRTTLQVVASKVERGEGTLGRLVNDDRLYGDINTTVKSLKALIEDIKANPKKYLKVEIF